MSEKLKKIGILGGMGPAASAQFHKELVEVAQRKYSAVEDLDFPDIVHYSLSLFGFDESGICDESLVLSQLISGVKLLESCGVDLIVIPCNTVHFFYEELVEVCEVPILHIARCVAEKICEFGFENVGLLGSQTTFKSNFYKNAIKDFGDVKVNYPCERFMPFVEKMILEAMGGNFCLDTKNEILNCIEDLDCENDCVVLGCTELPLGVFQSDTSVVLLNSISILVDKTLEFVYSGTRFEK